jgi:hypothetical protein
MSRGRTAQGRARTRRLDLTLPPSRPLIKAQDHGEPVRLDAVTVGSAGERWIEPFLAANTPALKRLDVRAEVSAEGGLHLKLIPGAHIGAIPLLAPSTRRVAAGLLVEPRFKWTALGAVFTAIGFSTEPHLGDFLLVPGSAREVPAWLLAAPVLRRLEGMLAHRRRGFVERSEQRTSLRGRVDWGSWARHDVPTGRWSSLPCTFPEPDDDPLLMAAVRWTLIRLIEELEPLRDALPARVLRERVHALAQTIGPGTSRRPDDTLVGRDTAWVADALQAMGWVAEERGLGGARSLDGMSWDLAVDAVWEAWVARFVDDLGQRIGMSVQPRGERRYRLNWQGRLASMGSLAPDSVLQGLERAIWVDAKYKAHLSLLARHGWRGLGEAVRDAHRADLHQALAYASLANVDRVDTVLAYPHIAEDAAAPPIALATVASGRRRVRLVLAGLPFGFRSPGLREQALETWRGWLAA